MLEKPRFSEGPSDAPPEMRRTTSRKRKLDGNVGKEGGREGGREGRKEGRKEGRMMMMRMMVMINRDGQPLPMEHCLFEA